MVTKAQIRMGETIAVLIIFFFLLGMGAIFYTQVQRTKVYSNIEETIAQDSIRISQIVSYLLEFQCSSENIVDDNCYDLYKIKASLGHINQNYDYYLPFLMDSEIVVEEIYPNPDSWVLYNNTNQKSAKIFTNIPISIYDPTTKKYAFGVLSVAYFPNYG